MDMAINSLHTDTSLIIMVILINMVNSIPPLNMVNMLLHSMVSRVITADNTTVLLRTTNSEASTAHGPMPHMTRALVLLPSTSLNLTRHFQLHNTKGRRKGPDRLASKLSLTPYLYYNLYKVP